MILSAVRDSSAVSTLTLSLFLFLYRHITSSSYPPPATASTRPISISTTRSSAAKRGMARVFFQFKILSLNFLRVTAASGDFYGSDRIGPRGSHCSYARDHRAISILSGFFFIRSFFRLLFLAHFDIHLPIFFLRSRSRDVTREGNCAGTNARPPFYLDARLS